MQMKICIPKVLSNWKKKLNSQLIDIFYVFWLFTLWGRWMLLMQTDIWKSLNGTQLFPTKSTSFRFVFTNTLTCYKGPTSLIWADFSFLFGSVNIFKSPFMSKKFASHVVLANASLCFSKVLYFCIGFWELSHLTCDLYRVFRPVLIYFEDLGDHLKITFRL